MRGRDRDTHAENFGPRALTLLPSLFNIAIPLLAFDWVPTRGRSLALGLLELTVHADSLANLPQNRIDLTLLVANEGGAPRVPVLVNGTLTNFSQQPAVMAAGPGLVAYNGVGVYNLAVDRNAICAVRSRLELWGQANPTRVIEVSGRLSLTTGVENDWRSVAYHFASADRGGGSTPPA
jgi:hypothetical protein